MMRWTSVLSVLLASGCSLVLGEETDDSGRAQIDAAPGGDALDAPPDSAFDAAAACTLGSAVVDGFDMPSQWSAIETNGSSPSITPSDVAVSLAPMTSDYTNAGVQTVIPRSHVGASVQVSVTGQTAAAVSVNLMLSKQIAGGTPQYRLRRIADEVRFEYVDSAGDRRLIDSAQALVDSTWRLRIEGDQLIADVDGIDLLAEPLTETDRVEAVDNVFVWMFAESDTSIVDPGTVVFSSFEIGCLP